MICPFCKEKTPFPDENQESTIFLPIKCPNCEKKLILCASILPDTDQINTEELIYGRTGEREFVAQKGEDGVFYGVFSELGGKIGSQELGRLRKAIHANNLFNVLAVASTYVPHTTKFFKLVSTVLRRAT